MESINTNPFTLLPSELIIEIFSNASTNDIINKISLVCKNWRDIANKECLWKEKYRKLGGDFSKKENSGKVDWRKLCISQEKSNLYAKLGNLQKLKLDCQLPIVATPLPLPPTLQELDLSNCNSITNITPLLQFAQLRSLNLSNSNG